MSSINDPFPGEWYADADRPSAPSAARMLAELRQRECPHPDDDRQPGPHDTWFCERCDKPELAEPEWSRRERAAGIEPTWESDAALSTDERAFVQAGEPAYGPDSAAEETRR